MRKNHLLLLLATACVTGKAVAQTQPCYTDEVYKRMVKANPDIQRLEDDINKQIKAGLRMIDPSKVAKTTAFTDQSGNKSFWYDIPVVVHVVHDYGLEYMKDTIIYNALKNWNITYAKQNADTTDVIAPFKKWIGNAHIRLHLATRDPLGNITTGITRRRSYTTYTGGESAKFDDWSPSSYLNLWFINQMSTANGAAAAYALPPSSAAGNPKGDGVISLYDYIDRDKTINHEIGHVFNLQHVWGNTNQPEVACGDDEVDDTPPTRGHNPSAGCSATALYDQTCAINYFQIYTSITGTDSLVNYPDTVNSQNIMDYTYCSRMFTIGQVERMHTCLNGTVAGRNNLWDTTNLINTGVWKADFTPVATPDMKPVPDFCAQITGVTSNYMDRICYFTFPGTSIRFLNETWRDTVTALSWNFTNSPSIAGSTSTASFNTSFADPGWVKLSLTATGNHTGDTTRVWDNAVFVADAAGRNPNGYYQEFDPSGDRDKWPMFNYYNNEFHWELANVGFYDNYSVKYTGFDNRLNPLTGTYPYTGMPKGDVDDMFSIPVDLSAYTTSTCNLDFYYSAASRSSTSTDISDTLIIEYSVNKASSWTKLAILSKGSLCNKGAIPFDYTPAGQEDWAPKTIPLPAAAKTPYTVFRFRYKPNVGSDGASSSGNNLYIDRISFSPVPAGVNNVTAGNAQVVVAPNPTTGDAWVIVKDAGTSAQIIVSDITGKVVYTTTEQGNGVEARIQIPQSAIATKGVYLVQTITGNQATTQKLVVY